MRKLSLRKLSKATEWQQKKIRLESGSSGVYSCLVQVCPSPCMQMQLRALRKVETGMDPSSLAKAGWPSGESQTVVTGETSNRDY